MVQRACHAAVADPTTKTALEFKRPHAPPQGWKIAHAANIPLTEPVNVRAWLTCSPCGLEMSLWKIVLCIQEVYPSNDDDLYTHLMMLACRCGGTAPPSALWGMSGGRRGTWRCRYGRHHCSGIAWKHKKGCGTAGAIALAWDARMLNSRHHCSGMAWKDAVYVDTQQQRILLRVLHTEVVLIEVQVRPAPLLWHGMEGCGVSSCRAEFQAL
eukprot:scaffold201290_cov22-Tisochrysis_lutea.AAC.1